MIAVYLSVIVGRVLISVSLQQLTHLSEITTSTLSYSHIANTSTITINLMNSTKTFWAL